MKKYTGKTSTAIIPYPDNKILLIKRNTIPFKGYWALPGGRMDPGETVEQTIVREVKEETGLDVTIVSKVGEYVEKGSQRRRGIRILPNLFCSETQSAEKSKSKTAKSKKSNSSA